MNTRDISCPKQDAALKGIAYLVSHQHYMQLVNEGKKYPENFIIAEILSVLKRTELETGINLS